MMLAFGASLDDGVEFRLSPDGWLFMTCGVKICSTDKGNAEKRQLQSDTTLG